MRLLFTLLLFITSFFAFSNNFPADTTFSISTFSSTTVCGNDSVNIVATGCSGEIIWNNGNTYNPFAIHAVQSGDYFATCVPTNEVSNTITVTFLPTPNPPTISLETVDSQYVLVASGCNSSVIWSNGSGGTSIVVTTEGYYFAICGAEVGISCSSRPSNALNVSLVPPPTISTDKTKICTLEYATLTATGCLGTIYWNNGSTGVSIQTNFPTTYHTFCVVNGNQSAESNHITITNIPLPSPNIYSPDNIYCLSPTVTLAASACPEGNIVWSNGSTATSITFSVAGTYSAQCQNQCGISGVSNTLIISSDIGSGVPVAPIISTNKNLLCDGENATLIAVGCTGNIIWSNGATTTSISVSQTGSYAAICQSQCGNSVSSNPIYLQASYKPAAPVVSSNKNILCDGESATLTASGCAGSVLWMTGATTPSIQVVIGGTYTATCQNICGNSLPSNAVIMRTYSFPTAPILTSNKSVVCNGETATLVASGCNGTILWSNGATVNTVQVFGWGTYTAICQNICGSIPASNEVILKAGPSPTIPAISASNTTICNQEKITLTANNCNGNILWSNAKTGSQITVSSGGTYYAQCETSCGSSDISNTINIIENSIKCTPIKVEKIRSN